MQGRARDLDRIDDPGLAQVAVFAALGIVAIVLLFAAADVIDDHRAIESRVLGNHPAGHIEHALKHFDSQALIAVQVELVDDSARLQKSHAAAGDDALGQSGPRRLEGVLIESFSLFHFRFGSRSDLDLGHAAGQLRQTLL